MKVKKRIKEPIVLEPVGPPTNGVQLVQQMPLLKLDLGCGANKREGFYGVDTIAFPGVDQVVNLAERLPESRPSIYGPVENPNKGFKSWPWPDNSVEEAHTSHFVEHLDSWERVHFFNELWRVLIPGGKCQLIVPHWCSCRAYGDPSHKWPPFSEFAFYYLSKEWRNGATKECPACKGSGRNPVGACAQCAGNGKLVQGPNAPHTDAANRPDGFKCDFDAVWGFGLHPQIALKNQEAQGFAMQFYKEAITDIIATLTCKKVVAERPSLADQWDHQTPERDKHG